MNKQDYIGQKIKKLRAEGKSQKQAVAIAINMSENKYQFGGGISDYFVQDPLTYRDPFAQLYQNSPQQPNDPMASTNAFYQNMRVPTSFEQAFPAQQPTTQANFNKTDRFNMTGQEFFGEGVSNVNVPNVGNYTTFQQPPARVTPTDTSTFPTASAVNYTPEFNNEIVEARPAEVVEQQEPQERRVVNRNVMFNPYTGVNVESAAFTLGRSLGYEGDRTGANTVRGAAAAGKIGLGLLRTVASGAGYQRADDRERQNFLDNLYNSAPYYQYFQKGGVVDSYDDPRYKAYRDSLKLYNENKIDSDRFTQGIGRYTYSDGSYFQSSYGNDPIKPLALSAGDANPVYKKPKNKIIVDPTPQVKTLNVKTADAIPSDIRINTEIINQKNATPVKTFGSERFQNIYLAKGETPPNYNARRELKKQGEKWDEDVEMVWLKDPKELGINVKKNKGYTIRNEDFDKLKEGEDFVFLPIKEGDRKSFQKGGTVTNGEKMTGAFMTEGDGQGVPVEVEQGEVVKNSQTGEIQEVVGEKHDKGGVDVQLPVESKVLSDYTKVGAAKAKQFRKDFDIKVKASDTYAKVMDKYDKKIGYNKAIEEETKIIEEIEEQQKSDIPLDTQDLNMNHLSEKIQDVESRKQGMEKLRTETFDKIFSAQEGNAERGTFSPEILAYAEQYNMTPERVSELITEQMKKGGEVKYKQKMQGGNRVRPNPYSRDQYGTQSLGEQPFISGDVSTAQEATARVLANQELYPYLLESSGLSNQVTAESVGAFQRGFNEYVQSGLSAAELNPYLTTEQKQELKTYLQDQTFTEEGVRGFDAVYGDYSSSRPGIALPILTESEKEKYPDIQFIGQTLDENGKIKEEYLDLSEETKKLIEETYEQAGQASRDIGVLTFSEPTQVTDVAQEEEQVSPQTVTRNVAQLPNVPVDFILPPSPMQPVRKSDVTLGRLEATKVSPEANLVEAERQRQAVTNSLQFLPDSQRAAAIASALGQTQTATNQAISQAEIANAQNQQRVDQFNIQQGDKQNILNEQFAEDYERKALAAMRNTNIDLRNYFTDLNNQQRFNFGYVDRRNALNQMFDRYQLTNQGVEYVPTTGNILSINPNLPNMQALYALNQLSEEDRVVEQARLIKKASK